MTQSRTSFPSPLWGACFAGLLLSLSACGPKASGDGAAKAPAPVPAATLPPGEFNVTLCLHEECGVMDQNGKAVIPFKNDYDGFAHFLIKDKVVVLKGDQWSLLNTKTQAPLVPIAPEIFDIVPGYIGFRRDGKMGLMDTEGREVQAPRFDDMYAGGKDNFIAYEVDGKMGVLDLQGKQLTEPLYTSMVLRGDLDEYGGLVSAERGEERWVINLKDGTQKKVTYSSLSRISDGHLVARDEANVQGLANAAGDLVIPVKYQWLGNPGGGRVAYREASGQPCGYLDYTGKVLIPPRFKGCEPFGKKGALVQVEETGEAKKKVGLVGLDGAWLTPPAYDVVGDAGHGFLGMLKHVPGYAHVGQMQGMFAYQSGLFDLDQGREIVPPVYKAIGLLTPDRFLFSEGKSPEVTFTVMGQSMKVPAVGLMDAKGKVLLAPTRFMQLEVDKSGRYLVASDGAEIPVRALYDLDGRELIGPQWQELVVDSTHSVVRAYSVEGLGDNAVRTLRAMYDLQGKPLFSVQKAACGAEQVVDGANQPVWPLDMTPYCPKK